MRGISTFNLLLKGVIMASVLTVGSNHAFAQSCNTLASSDCNIPVTYNFNNLPVGSTGGFSGDFEYDASQSDQSNSSTYLQSKTPLTPIKNLITPTFTVPTTPGQLLEYRFELRGTANVTSFDVYVVVAGQTDLLICNDVVPSYEQGSSLAFVCASRPLTTYNLGGKVARLRFEFSLTGSTNHVVTFDNFGLFIDGSQIVLPVNFTDFSAKKAAKGTQLTWNVADEVNVSRYEVQKGSNAGDLKTIGIVFAGERTSYAFTDENPSQGVSFYRIRSVDADGKFKFSTVISFSNGRSAALLRAFPLPAQNQVTLQHGTIEGKAQISITSEDGRTVRRLVPAIGSMQTAIDLTGLKAGMYLLRLENSNGEVETLKLIKQ